MSSPEVQDQLGQVLIDFSTNGRFPEEEKVSSAFAESSILPSALDALSTAKSELEVISDIYPSVWTMNAANCYWLQVEIRQISHDSGPEVDDWIAHAKSIQDDIKKSRNLANEIVRRAEADEERLEGLQEKEVYADFLNKEVLFNACLLKALKSIQDVHTRLIGAEELVAQRKLHEALLTLEGRIRYSPFNMMLTYQLLGTNATAYRWKNQ